jgi:hypothetical protein
MLATSGGPHEYWVVHVAGEVAAYTENLVCGQWVHHSAVYYHPDHLRHMTAFALVRSLQEEYVLGRRLTLLNGTRTILHDTSYNDVLRRLGFRQIHCRICVAYRPLVARAVSLAYPLRGALARLPSVRGVGAARAVLMLEEIRRSQQRARREPKTGSDGQTS